MRPQGQPVGRMDPAVSKCDWSSGRETYRLWGRWVTWCFPSVDLTQKDRKPDGRAINEILARINAAEPPDGIEAIQAAQTAMIHQATIRAARQTEGFGKFPGRDSNSNSPNQLNADLRHRGRGSGALSVEGRTEGHRSPIEKLVTLANRR